MGREACKFLCKHLKHLNQPLDWVVLSWLLKNFRLHRLQFHHVANLESRLNVDLFHRQVRKITLTTTGQRLAAAISEGFRKIEDALDEITVNGNVVRVASTSSLAAMLLIPSINEFYQLHPNISVEFSTGETLDNHLYTLPIRYGDVSLVQSQDIVKYESFNVFGSLNLICLNALVNQ